MSGAELVGLRRVHASETAHLRALGVAPSFEEWHFELTMTRVGLLA